MTSLEERIERAIALNDLLTDLQRQLSDVQRTLTVLRRDSLEELQAARLAAEERIRQLDAIPAEPRTVQ